MPPMRVVGLLRVTAAAALAAAVVVVAHSCGDGSARCLPSNCNGCCAGSVCVRTSMQDDFGCGLGGLACRPCSTTQSCRAGRCLTALDTIDSGNGSTGGTDSGLE